MSSKAVVDAVAARLAAHWTFCPVLVDGSDVESPANGDPYVMVQFPFAREEQITIGAPGHNVFRENGGIRIVLSWRTGQKLDQALDWIDQLRAIFRGAQFDGVNCYAPSPSSLDNAQHTGSRVLLSSAVPYYFDIFA
jgi:hypothetical protein